jgi:hypothetical protein
VNFLTESYGHRHAGIFGGLQPEVAQRLKTFSSIGFK